MEQRQLGVDGPLVPVICFGAWPLGGGIGHIADAEAITIVQRAVDLDVAFVDTQEV